MRLVEADPKHKNYSRTKVIYYRVDMITEHRTVGLHEYYTTVFDVLNLTVDEGLNSWLIMKYIKKVKKYRRC